MDNKKEVIYIQPEDVIISLMKASNKSYLCYFDLFNFISYFRKALSNEKNKISDIKFKFNLNIESVERSIRYYDDVFASVGGTVVVKDKYDNFSSTPMKLEIILMKYANEFVKNNAIKS